MNQAKKAGVQLRCFDSVKNFIENVNSIPTNSYIYIDSNLKDGEVGEIEAQRIATIGYLNIHITTGYSKSHFDILNLPWVKGIVSKTPPF